ncbi:MAG: sulfotransferase domain-containing protein [Actinomycetota bacterium]|nr:sulfotransferase domain-containing protein [Actinomycetota bacterium]
MRKTNALVRLGMVHLLSGVLPLYVVNEYPKSGGSWAGQMLGRALGVPFPRNRIPALRSSIIHGHFLNPWGMKNVTVVWRDGRDLMVSWYHHCLFENERHNARLVEIVRRDLPFEDYDDVRGNLPAFIEYAFTCQRHPSFSWAGFVRRWHAPRKGVVHTGYEALRRDTLGELGRIVRELSGRKLDPERAREIADEFSFARQSGREPGEENKASFIRKGVVGDWKEQFTPKARRVFDRYAGEELILLGYEKDHAWAKTEADERSPAP